MTEIPSKQRTTLLEAIIELSVRNRYMVLILTFITAVAGVYAIANTSVDAIPDLS